MWGYREKPRGVPNNHAGDIFLIHKDMRVTPKVVGISLKAGTAKSKEPKLNSYVGTTLRKDAWKRAYPRAIDQLKDKLWNCLLYTSPSPRDRTRSRMPSSA